ncbi:MULTISPECIES: hypothetical protein [Hyphobacterium]|uniref:Uncharacterized protein n=1 Tax=Hyphobacterium vulgare TaxID=1736751 RepID=A0ABV6ZW68_9PROT
MFNPLRLGATFVVFFIVCFLLSGVTAQFMIVPMYGEGLGDMLRAADDASGFVPMLSGFALYALAAAWLILTAMKSEGWVKAAIHVGLALCVVIVGQYAILPGWSVLPAGPTIGSGVVSSLPTLPAAFAAAFTASKLK